MPMAIRTPHSPWQQVSFLHSQITMGQQTDSGISIYSFDQSHNNQALRRPERKVTSGQLCHRVLVNNNIGSFVSRCHIPMRQPLNVRTHLYKTIDLMHVYLGLWLFLIALSLNASILFGKCSCISHQKKNFYKKLSQKKQNKTSNGIVGQPHLRRNILENQQRSRDKLNSWDPCVYLSAPWGDLTATG